MEFAPSDTLFDRAVELLQSPARRLQLSRTALEFTVRQQAAFGSGSGGRNSPDSTATATALMLLSRALVDVRGEENVLRMTDDRLYATIYISIWLQE